MSPAQPRHHARYESCGTSASYICLPGILPELKSLCPPLLKSLFLSYIPFILVLSLLYKEPYRKGIGDHKYSRLRHCTVGACDSKSAVSLNLCHPYPITFLVQGVSTTFCAVSISESIDTFRYLPTRVACITSPPTETGMTVSILFFGQYHHLHLSQS